MLFADNTHEINIHTWIHLQSYFPGWDPLLPSLIYFIPPCCSPLFYLLVDPSFGDRGANVHPLSSLVSDQLFTPCFLTLPNPSRRHPWFMLHVYRDDITTSATLSDTVVIIGNRLLPLLRMCMIKCFTQIDTGMQHHRNFQWYSRN